MRAQVVALPVTEGVDKGNSTRRRRGTLSSDIDLESVRCVEGHVWDWDNAVYQRATKGILRGLPVRSVPCEKCRSTKDEHMSWNGRVLSRSYDLEPEYIETARRLDDDMHERRYQYRRLRLLRALQPTPAELNAPTGRSKNTTTLRAVKGGRRVDTTTGELLEG